MSAADETAPLAGVRVLECGHYIAGPRCTQILADHGAEVIKLEPPGGDASRQSAPIREGWSMYFAAHNRRKRSVVIDLKQPGGREILDRMIKWADVIVTSYRPSASEKLGLTYAAASKLNPRIVVVRISAFGAGPNGRSVPGFDGTVQARSGLAHMVGEADGPPTITSVPLMDYFTAVQASLAAMLGLRLRDQTGRGTEYDVSMMDAATTTLGYLFAEVMIAGVSPKRTGSRAPYALTAAYEAADGFVYIAPMGGPAWAALANLIGKPEWAKDDHHLFDAGTRLTHRDEVERAITTWTRTLPRAAIVRTLTEAGVPCGVVNSVNEVATDPLLIERKMLTDVRLGTSDTTVPMPGIELKRVGANGAHPAESPAAVPELGMHTDEVLTELGFDPAQVATWAENKVIYR